MARPKNEDILAGLKRELSRSRRWRDHEDFDGLWRRMIDLYRGRHYDNKTKTDRIVVNMAFATINVIGPSIAVNNPKIVLNARQPDHAHTAIIAGEVINYEWRRNRFQDEYRRATDDKLMIGHGWLKVGYKYATSDVPAVQPEEDAKNDNETEGGPQVEEDVSVEVNQIVTEDRPILERVSPFDMFLDPDARHPKELRWIAQRIKRPVNDAKRDRRYDRKARSELAAGIAAKWETQDQEPAHGNTADPEKHGYVEIIEFWDLVAGTVCTFADNGDKFLIAPKKSPYPFTHPFFMVRNYEVPDELYPMGELEAIEVLQHELNQTRTQMLNHRKKFSRKWLYRKSAFEQDGLNQLASDDDNALVPVESDAPLGDVIAPMPTAITPPEFYNQSQMIQDDINLVSATSEYTRGSMPDIRRTATEAAMIQDSQNARSADKLAKVESELSQVAEKLLKVVQAFTTGDKVIRIVGQDGASAWGYWDRDYIQGDFDFEVEAGSTQPMNETFRRQSAMQMMDALTPLAEVINLPELARHVLQEGFGVKNPSRFIIAPPPQAGPGGMPPDPNAPTPGGMALSGAVPQA
jgi:hypothetical protein